MGMRCILEMKQRSLPTPRWRRKSLGSWLQWWHLLWWVSCRKTMSFLMNMLTERPGTEKKGQG